MQRSWTALAMFLIAGVGTALLTSCTETGRAKPRVVLYCAQDKEFAEGLLAEFEKKTGIHVDAKYDTEANKSVGLYKELAQEQDRPRCDVFWNNEILSTIRLARQGVLAPGTIAAAKPFPASAKAQDEMWYAFAARARVLLVNTHLVSEKDRPQRLQDLTNPRWKGRIAMAKPQFGTTATHAACLFQVWGPDKAKKFFRDLKNNDLQIVAGNKQVADGVADSQFAVGITDTDDAMGAIREGKPVAMIFPDRVQINDDLIQNGTLFIPNTIAVIRGAPNAEHARKLMEFLLSPEVEARLAEGESHQIPLNPEVKAALPKEMETPSTVHAMTVDFDKAAALWDETQRFLADEIIRP